LFGALVFLFLTSACGGQRIGMNASEATARASQLGTQTGTLATQVTTPGLAGTAVVPETRATLTAVSPSLDITPVGPAASTAAPDGIPVTGVSAASVLCQFCVDQIPHAVVLLPQAATFSMVGADGSAITSDGRSACNTVEALNGNQVVVCFGAAGTTINLNVCTNGSNCAQMPLKLDNCPAIQSTGLGQANTPAAVPSVIATIPTSGTIPTTTALP
jgi:hypothetical protein